MDMGTGLEALKRRAQAREAGNDKRFGYTLEEWEAIQRYHQALAEYCTGLPEGASCERCGLRLYCFSAPQSVTAEMVDNVISILERG